MTRTHLAIALLAGCGHASSSADGTLRNEAPRHEARTKPSFDEMRDVVHAFAQRVPYYGDGFDVNAAVALLGEPLWFEGFSYSSVKNEALAARCTARRG